MSVTGQRKAASGNGTAARQAETKTQEITGSRPFRWLVRAGFVARGVTYGIVGALALALALDGSKGGTSASQQGALTLISRSSLGRVALILVAAGLLAYALWKLVQGVLGRGPEGGGGASVKDRVANLGGGIAYIVFFSVAVRTLVAGGGSSSGGPKSEATGVLGWPGGPVLVGLTGGTLLAISGFQIYEAIRGNFAEEAKTSRMGLDQRRLYMLLGRIGICARSLVFILVGYFLIKTAIEFDPSSAVGVDGALARLHRQTLGPVLVGVVAAGLLVFATFSLFEARFRRL